MTSESKKHIWHIWSTKFPLTLFFHKRQYFDITKRWCGKAVARQIRIFALKRNLSPVPCWFCVFSVMLLKACIIYVVNCGWLRSSLTNSCYLFHQRVLFRCYQQLNEIMLGQIYWVELSERDILGSDSEIIQ